jgi:protein O-mannosyl-transferase
MPISPDKGKRPIPAWFDVAIIVAVTAAIYAQVAGHSFIVYDDPLYVTGNSHVLGGLSWSSFLWAWANFDAANYHPLTWLSYLLDIQIFGPRPGCMALENVVFHTFNGWLVARILRALGCSRWGALFGALAFVAHPLNVESVAWISERKTELAAAFGFTAILIYLRRAQRGLHPVNWAVLLTLTASLLCKPWFVVLPCLFLAFDLWPLRRFPSFVVTASHQPDHPKLGPLAADVWPLLREKLPLFGLVLAVSAAAILSQQTQGGIVSLHSVSLGLRLQNACVSIAAYLSDTFRLGDFSLYYSRASTLPLSQVIMAVGLLTLVTFIVVALARRWPALLVAWLWFLLFLLPVIGLVQVGSQTRADRYMYLPLVGLLWALIVLAEQAWSALSPTLRPVLLIAASVWTVALGFAAYRQTSLWRNSFGIVGHSIEVSGAGPRLVGMLGIAHLQAGRWQAATPLLERSLHGDPANSSVAVNLAFAYARMGRTREAIALVDQVLAQEPANYFANNNLAAFYHLCGDEAAASEVEARMKTLHPQPGIFSAPPSP